MKKAQWAIALLVAIGLMPAAAWAQERGAVTGVVTDQATQQPVRGAQVVINGTMLSTITNQQGRYLIPNVPVGTHEVRAVLLGYGATVQSVAVVASESAVLDFQLSQFAIELDALVVTGTAGLQQRRAQSATVATVNAAAVAEKAPVTTVTDLMQGRNPGVSITQASGTSGTAQRIRLRGQSSINLSNDPIVFIDGIRADTRSDMFAGLGGQATSRLNDIRPEDIESIEIIKGPAAATLYGADASAGVIQIITKKGRLGGGFSQTISMEYNSIDIAGYEPLANWAACDAAQVANAAVPACYGKPVGTILSDRPSDRHPGVFRTGQMRSLNWSGVGGGENYGFRLSLGADEEEGVFPSNEYGRISGAVNFRFVPNPKLQFETGLNMVRTRGALPRNDNNIYGFLGGIMLGSPVTVGTARDGWYGANRHVEALTALEYIDTSIRTIPRISVNYQPFDWFTHRVTLGADMTRTEAHSFYPKNDKGWYASALNVGDMDQNRRHRDDITFDYLGNITTELTQDWSSTLSFGTQVNAVRSDLTWAQGRVFITNANRSVSSAAERTGGQTFSESRQVGLFAQWQPVFRDRLFFQFAGRFDRTSAFGTEADWFFSPKVGASYVISDEGFWQNSMPEWFNTMRLRASWGATGRSPGSGALTTFTAAPYAITASRVELGVRALNPGNDQLRPERGEEIEAGFDLGLFDQRLGLEVTYFNKVSKDLILAMPIPPSLGFQADPLVNIGSIVNRGFEVGLNANVINRENLGWDVRLGFNTLHNEVTDMGVIDPIGTYTRILPGYQVNSAFDFRTREIVTDPTRAAAVCGGEAECVIVSDSTEWVGNYLPGFEGNLSTTLSFAKNFQINALLGWQSDFVINNNTDDFRERTFGTGERWVNRADLPTEERLLRYGPFVRENGQPIEDPKEVTTAYMEKGDFLRLREVSLTYTLPQHLARAIRASGASVTLAGRNLALWTDYSGTDPEVLQNFESTTTRVDFLSMPQTRRWVARVNLNF
jgi:TonB-linked SusC/RagA family outer membrane protein